MQGLPQSLNKEGRQRINTRLPVHRVSHSCVCC